MKYWLVKSEPGAYSIADLRRDKRTLWTEVRNYQARNYLRSMAPGDRVLFYHSNSDPAGVAGMAEVTKAAVPDPTQFERSGEYFDPKAEVENPRWFAPEIRFVSAFENLVTLARLKDASVLSEMVLLQKGSRLSVQPVRESEMNAVLGLAEEAAGKGASKKKSAVARTKKKDA